MNETPKPSFDTDALDHLLTWVQSGVVSRRQIRELHGTDADIARMVRRRELVVVHPGVYVNHTGALSWDQRAWAAVLYYWPAALTRESALPKPKRTGPVHVAVGLRRNPAPIKGVVVHRTADFDARVRWIRSPPRVGFEHAAIDVASATADRFAAFSVFAEACQTRETTAEDIAKTLAARPRVPGRAFLTELVADLAAGACSTLEREWLELERSHGLPIEGTRQRPATIAGRSAFRDVDHADFGLVVELDGRAYHDSAEARDRDFTRDLETAVTTEQATVRLTYGQVLRRGCVTVRQVATLLERGGWSGPFQACPSCPPPA